MGAYAWDVPEGLWQVKYEKEGYETAYSDWLPVPPPQLDVNIGLISTEKPTVLSASKISNGVAVTFSQYMQPDTLKEITVTDAAGKNLDYELSYATDETAPDGTVYAKVFTLTVSGGTADSVTVPGTAKNYAGTSIDKVAVKVTDNTEKKTVIPDGIENTGKVTVEFGSPAPIDGVLTVLYDDGTTAQTTYKIGDMSVSSQISTKKVKSVEISAVALPEIKGAYITAVFYIPGDVNGSGEVTLDDAIQVLKKAMNVDMGSGEFNEAAADVVQDGNITLDDAITILKIATNVAV